jgi:hypothetical protein
LVEGRKEGRQAGDSSTSERRLSTSSSSLHEWNTSDEKTLVDRLLPSIIDFEFKPSWMKKYIRRENPCRRISTFRYCTFDIAYQLRVKLSWMKYIRKETLVDEPLHSGSMKYIYEKTHGWWTSKRRFGTRDIDYQLRVKPAWMKYIRRENPYWRASKFSFSQSSHALSTSSSAFTNEIRPTRKPLTNLFYIEVRHTWS